MINPADLEKIGTEEGKEMFPQELLAEFENGRGDDEDDELQQQSVSNVH